MSEKPIYQLIRITQRDATRFRLLGGPLPSDGVVWVWDHPEPLSPEVAALLDAHPWPFGWSVITQPRAEGGPDGTS